MEQAYSNRVLALVVKIREINKVKSSNKQGIEGVIKVNERPCIF
jgi:hypothetical protein